MQTERRRSPRNEYWAHGELMHLAKEAVLSYNTVISLIHRVRRASYQVAQALAIATRIMGREIPAEVWVSNIETDHPAFRVPTEPAGSVNIDKVPVAEMVRIPRGPKVYRKDTYRRNAFWACGELNAVAKAAKISRRILTMILHRRISCSYPIAIKLEKATQTTRNNRCIDREEWLDNLGSCHPAFSGEPVKKSRRPEHMFVNIDKKSETISAGPV